MPDITLFQCIPAYKSGPTSRLINNLAAVGCRILLDIEDSIQSVESPNLTPVMKECARQEVLDIVNKINGQKVSLRINSISTNEFRRDLELLNVIDGQIESVFIPKVESASELHLLKDLFNNRFSVNPIIETKEGVDNLNDILIPSYADFVEFVFFGNYDYHLSTNSYPVIEQNSPLYWDFVHFLISDIEQRGYNFGNSPYANIADLNCLHTSVNTLRRYCTREFAIMSLHRSQTDCYRTLINNSDNVSDSIARAHEPHSVSEFHACRAKGRSFAFTGSGQIITPQEYLLMLRNES